MKLTDTGTDWILANMAIARDDGSVGVAGAFDPVEGRVLISDETHWNPHAPKGDELARISSDFQAQGVKTAIVITPAIFFDNTTWELKSQVEIDELLAHLERDVAAVDIVGVDPYTSVSGVSDEWLINFTHIADEWIHARGKEAVLVVQDFAAKGHEQRTTEFVLAQIAGQSYDEVAVFGVEDGADLVAHGGFVNIGIMGVLENYYSPVVDNLPA